jgi:hypothetical protein
VISYQVISCWFQSLPFKRNLHRYIADALSKKTAEMIAAHKAEAAAWHKVGLCRLNQVDP